MKLQSTYALINVKHGRKNLKKLIDYGRKIKVVIIGTIDTVFGNDDGESREFNVDVDKVDVLNDE